MTWQALTIVTRGWVRAGSGNDSGQTLDACNFAANVWLANPY